MTEKNITLKITHKSSVSNHDFNTDEIIIGRHSACDVVLFEEGVSRHHSTIKFAKNAFWVVDNKSLNGTFLNKEKLGAPVKLKCNDTIEICGVKIETIFNLDGTNKALFTDDTEATIIKPKEVPLLNANRTGQNLNKNKKGFFEKLKAIFQKGRS